VPENTELPALPSMNEIHQWLVQALTRGPGNASRGLDTLGENRQALEPAGEVGQRSSGGSRSRPC